MKAKRLVPLLGLGLLLLAGCAQTHYVLTLRNGMQIHTSTKPKLEQGVYSFKDTNGRDVKVPSGKVREVAPADMASGPTTPQMGPPPSR